MWRFDLDAIQEYIATVYIITKKTRFRPEGESQGLRARISVIQIFMRSQHSVRWRTCPRDQMSRAAAPPCLRCASIANPQPALGHEAFLR